ncbi:MAG: hypothetical protein AAF668_06480 [Pseudomonadota bacterium]
MTNGFARTLHKWGYPLTLGLLSLFGLVLALIGDGVWDALSVAILAIPVAVCVWIMLKLRYFKSSTAQKKGQK